MVEIFIEIDGRATLLPIQNGTEDFLSGSHSLGSNGTSKNDPICSILIALWRIVDLNAVWS